MIDLPPKENSVIDNSLGLQYHSVITGKDIDWFIVANHYATYAQIKSRTGFRYILSNAKCKEVFGL